MLSADSAGTLGRLSVGGNGISHGGGRWKFSFGVWFAFDPRLLQAT